MVTKKTEQGRQSQDLGNVAEETFCNLIKIWLAKTDANDPSRFMPDSQKIDFVVELPSLWKGMPSIRTFWQVKSSSQRLTKYKHPELDSECFHLPFKPKDFKSLKESVQQHEHFYLAFAHNSSNAESFELRERPLQERFEWYCVDLSQQLAGDGQENYLVIPVQNKLNLSTFSLLWSSLWVEKFYNPLNSRTAIELPSFENIVSRVYPKKHERTLGSGNWDSLIKDLSRYEKDFEKGEFSKVSFALGIGCLLENINKKLYDASSSLDTIQTYCPESLYGTANLWLFAKSYHGFMNASGQVLKIDGCGKNLRILPLPNEPQKISGLIKACLWHIVLLYSALDVEVRIIHQPSLDAGSDHSYYGGGIGYFPWLNLSNDGVTWVIENNVEATSGRHRDFIHEHMDNLFIDPYRDKIWVANSFGLHPNDLRLAPKCPAQLFAKSGRFIQYPYFIFGDLGFRSLESLRQQLYKY
jgi:hypothetical protein